MDVNLNLKPWIFSCLFWVFVIKLLSWMITNGFILQEFLKALIGFIDVAGLYFALTQLTHRNISQNHKFQAVGLGMCDKLDHFVLFLIIFMCILKSYFSDLHLVLGGTFLWQAGRLLILYCIDWLLFGLVPED